MGGLTLYQTADMQAAYTPPTTFTAPCDGSYDSSANDATNHFSGDCSSATADGDACVVTASFGFDSTGT